MPVKKSKTRSIKGKWLTPELINAISERVYALLLADLRLARERARRSHTGRWPNLRP